MEGTCYKWSSVSLVFLWQSVKCRDFFLATSQVGDYAILQVEYLANKIIILYKLTPTNCMVK